MRPQILGQRTDHAYSKACDCSTCEAVRVKAREVRDKAVERLMKPLVEVGTLVGCKTGRAYRVAVAPNALCIGTLERATPKVRGKKARKQEKRERRRLERAQQEAW
jgi:hypothetical protein